MLLMLTNEHDIAQAFMEQRPPRQPLHKLPTCPASELSPPISFADADPSDFRHTCHEAMAKAVLGVCDGGTFFKALRLRGTNVISANWPLYGRQTSMAK